MGLQKALNSDGWINPDASHGALHRQPHRNGGSAGAESACEAAGVGGDLTAGGTLKQIPPLESVPPQPPLHGLLLLLVPLLARPMAPALSSGSSSLAAASF